MERNGSTSSPPFAARDRMAYKPAALRSLDVCLDAEGPFIEVVTHL
jgi:hypothetical protein